MQTLWGITKAPHLLHLDNEGTDIFQLALRLSLLDLDDLFLGQIDMAYTSLLFAIKNIHDSRHLKIRGPAVTAAVTQIEIVSAYGTQTLTIFFAENLHGQMRDKLIINQNICIKRLFFHKTDIIDIIDQSCAHLCKIYTAVNRKVFGNIDIIETSAARGG